MVSIIGVLSVYRVIISPNENKWENQYRVTRNALNLEALDFFRVSANKFIHLPPGSIQGH